MTTALFACWLLALGPSSQPPTMKQMAAVQQLPPIVHGVLIMEFRLVGLLGQDECVLPEVATVPAGDAEWGLYWGTLRYRLWLGTHAKHPWWDLAYRLKAARR